MPKSRKKDKNPPYYAIDEVLKWTPTQFLGRIADLEKDIDTAKQHRKDAAAAAKDTIADYEGRKKELFKIIPREFLGSPAGHDQTIEEVMRANGIPVPTAVEDCSQ